MQNYKFKTVINLGLIASFYLLYFLYYTLHKTEVLKIYLWSISYIAATETSKNSQDF